MKTNYSSLNNKLNNDYPKVLLITPPCIDLYRGMRKVISKFPPLGIAYIASFLERKGVKVDIYDSFAEDATMSDIYDKIRYCKANIIGISSVTSTIKEAVKIAEFSKSQGKIVVIGGIHFTSMPTETFQKFSCFDYGIVGEGENPFYELIMGVELKDIKGLVYRNGSSIIINKPADLIKDLSILPNPARNLLKNRLYRSSNNFFINRKPFTSIITSRGCPFNCVFCASKIMWGTKVRYRPVEDIFNELDEIKKMGIKQIQIVDDTFTLAIDRVRHITKKIKSLNFEWGCNARVDKISPEILTLLKSSNCMFIEFGIESGNQNILNSMKKGITLEQARLALKLVKKLGIKSSCNFIIGNLGDTEKTIKETISFAKELNPDYALFHMLTPYPGTELFEIVQRNHYLIKDIEDYTNPKYSDCVIELPGLDSKRIKSLSMKAYKSFYFRPRYIFRALSQSFFSFDEIKKNYSLLKSFLNVK